LIETESDKADLPASHGRGDQSIKIRKYETFVVGGGRTSNCPSN